MKHIFTLIVVGFPLIACVDKASADVYWNNNNGAAPGGDRSWGNAANWSGGGIGTLPSASGAGNAIVKPWPDLTQMPIVNTLGNTATQVYLTEGSSLSVVTGGSLLVNSYVTGQWNNCGVTDVSGGLLQAASLLLGNGGFDGKINISGGSVLANYLSINVSGGARMNISGNGSFVAPTSNLGNINFWITNNAIQAYGGKGTINVDTNSQSGKIVLTAVAPDCHWTGSVSSDWAGAGNWDTDPLLPSAPWINAIINPSSNRPTVSTLGNTAKDLYLSPNASLAVTNGGSLTVGSYVTGEWGDSGTTDVSGGLLQAANLLLGNGGFDGKINISGGSVLANYLSINVSGGARMNISGNGSFVAPTSNLGNIKYWIEHHAIQAYGGSGAVRIDTTSQAGKIVLTALVSGYSSWAANNAPSGNAADDYDNDGVSNGVECVLGGALNTNDSAKLPQLSIMGGNVIFTFVRDQASIPGTTLEIQVGTDLANWPTIYTVGADTAGSSNGVTVLKDTPATGKDTITLSRPQSDLPTKLFARLCVRTN